MKEGRYFRIPEGPGDVQRLWSQAVPVTLSHAPDWLTPEDAPSYRQVPSVPWAALPSVERDAYLAELQELADMGLIIEDHPADPAAHQIFLAAPRADEIWSIGIFGGPSPFDLGPLSGAKNPILTRDDVTDVSATYVADPFMIRAAGAWHMFFEVMNWRSGKGEIGLATSADGLAWQYRQIVLSEPFHLSYPYVFEWRGDYFLVPESFQAGAVRLYKAAQFPTRWEYVSTILAGPYLVDASPFRYRDRWWLLVDGSLKDQHDTLRLFWAEDLLGPWREHSASPVVQGDPHHARPAGRVIVWQDRIFRFAQNCSPTYGADVRALEVTELTDSGYRERSVSDSPILGPSGSGWNAGGMHHVDPHCLPDGSWIACVDGWYAPTPSE